MVFSVLTADKGLNKLDARLLSCLTFLLFPLKGSKVKGLLLYTTTKLRYMKVWRSEHEHLAEDIEYGLDISWC